MSRSIYSDNLHSLLNATIVAAPTSTKNREGTQDPEMGSTKKGTSWHFGLKAHIAVIRMDGCIAW